MIRELRGVTEAQLNETRHFLNMSLNPLQQQTSLITGTKLEQNPADYRIKENQLNKAKLGIIRGTQGL